MFSTELAEIVLIVEDVKRSARFYRDVVGLVPENEPDDGWAWFWAGEPGQAQRVALRKGPLLFEEESPLPEGERWGRVHYAFNVPREKLEEVYRTNTLSPLALIQALRNELKQDARVINVTSDAAVEPYEGWGGYGSSKAALEQLSNILAAENPNLRVYRVDPGDMRTRMHQEAFPDEDISDRPLPEVSVPGLLELITGDLPGGRYEARTLAASASTRDR